MVHLILITQGVLEGLIIVSVCIVIFAMGYFIREKFLVYYGNWKIKKCNQRWAKKMEENIQWQRKWKLEQKLHKEERRKYPLFYWRENINGNT